MHLTHLIISYLISYLLSSAAMQEVSHINKEQRDSGLLNEADEQQPEAIYCTEHSDCLHSIIFFPSGNQNHIFLSF